MEVVRLTRERDELRRVNRRLDKSLQVALHNASQDELSGFLNRRAGQATFHVEIGRGLRERSPTALLVLDLDGFKKVNDTLGHDHGDKLLARIAQQMRSVLRDYDHPIRWGGDEFCIILPNTDVERGKAVAKKVLRAVRNASNERDLVVTASCGIAASDEPQMQKLLSDLHLPEGRIHGLSGDTYSHADVVETAISRIQRFLFKAADLRCYCAKHRRGTDVGVGGEQCGGCDELQIPCEQTRERERIKNFFWREDGSKWIPLRPAHAVDH